jgi:SSS family solute:Na+ symporter
MLFVLVIVVMIIVSFFTKAKDTSAIQGLYFGSATAEQRAITRASWGKWDVINSAIIIAFIIAFYIYFW